MNEALLQLRAVLDELQKQQRIVNVFFRDDDVDEDEPSLRALLALFSALETPINLQIIPALLTDEAVQLLREAQVQRPDLIELNQHGWRHINHEVEGRKCEFGASRSFDDQLADIAQGREVLEQAFGNAFSPVFTPPWNRCTQDTYRALDKLGFRALSQLQGGHSVASYKFRELSVTLDLFRWKGGAVMKSSEEFIAELTAQLRELNLVGIMLHHKVMGDAALTLLQMVISELRCSEAIRFHTFQRLPGS